MSQFTEHGPSRIGNDGGINAARQIVGVLSCFHIRECLDCDVVLSCRRILTLRRKILPPSSGFKIVGLGTGSVVLAGF